MSLGTLFSTIFFVGAVSVLCACMGDINEDLGNGYTFRSTNGYNHHIAHNYKVVVDSNVTEYRVVGDYITGKREPSSFPVGDQQFVSSIYGYFVLDMKTGQLSEGVDLAKISALNYPEE